MVIIEIRVTSGARNLLEIGRRDKSAGGQRSADRKILVRYPCKATEHRLSENGQTSSKRKEAGPLLYFLTRVIMTVFVVTTEISLTYLLTDHANSSPPFTSTSDPPQLLQLLLQLNSSPIIFPRVSTPFSLIFNSTSVQIPFTDFLVSFLLLSPSFSPPYCIYTDCSRL